VEQVRRAAPDDFPGPWPRLSIWHGEADRVVDPANARLLAEQWSELHGLHGAGVTTESSSVRRQVWGESKLPAVELWSLPGQPHAWPADAASCVARFWGLGPG
jgi:poly(3-hydroxybutyrate) depolymerase